jgi:hypothetical protein
MLFAHLADASMSLSVLFGMFNGGKHRRHQRAGKSLVCGKRKMRKSVLYFSHSWIAAKKNPFLQSN